MLIALFTLPFSSPGAVVSILSERDIHNVWRKPGVLFGHHGFPFSAFLSYLVQRYSASTESSGAPIGNNGRGRKEWLASEAQLLERVMKKRWRGAIPSEY